jgi:MFS family permease
MKARPYALRQAVFWGGLLVGPVVFYLSGFIFFAIGWHGPGWLRIEFYTFLVGSIMGIVCGFIAGLCRFRWLPTLLIAPPIVTLIHYAYFHVIRVALGQVSPLDNLTIIHSEIATFVKGINVSGVLLIALPYLSRPSQPAPRPQRRLSQTETRVYEIDN